MDLVDFQASDKSGRVHVETTAGSYRHAPAGGPVGHVAAMAELDRRLCTFGMDGICDSSEIRHDFLSHPELTVKGESGPVYCGIGQGGHSDPSASHCDVVVVQVLGRTVAISHVLERRRAYYPVAQGHRTYRHRCENRRFYRHILVFYFGCLSVASHLPDEWNHPSDFLSVELSCKLDSVPVVDPGSPRSEVGKCPYSKNHSCPRPCH